MKGRQDPKIKHLLQLAPPHQGCMLDISSIFGKSRVVDEETDKNKHALHSNSEFVK